MAAALLPDDLAETVRTTPDVGIEVTRHSVRVVY